jgi:hypothetical protein
MLREHKTADRFHRAYVVWCAALVLLLSCVNASPARAAFGFKTLSLTFTEEGAAAATQAGSHPFVWTTALALNTTGSGEEELPDGALKDLRIQLPPGLVGTPGLLPHCSHADFLTQTCPAASEVGGIGLSTSSAETEGLEFPLYNLEPLLGNAAELALSAQGVPIVIELQIAAAPPYNLIASISNASQAAAFFGSTLTIHGVSGSVPFLTLPRSCAPAPTTFEADPWGSPGSWVSSLAPEPLHPTGCGKLGFSPTLAAQPTTTAAAAPSGLDLTLNAPDEGIASATGTAQADISRAVLSFPPRMTINPALAAGLTACTPAELARETPTSAPGEGCPQGAKIGTAEVTTPLLDGAVAGTIFVAAPDDPATATPGAENPLDARFALYLVLRDPERGVLLSLPIRIDPDPQTGRLTASFDQIPQLPLSHLELHFNPGPHAPLTTPASCGSHSVTFTLTPSSCNPPLSGSEIFTTTGPDCTPSFAPTLSAGTASNAAGHSAPFVLDLSQDAAEANLSGLSLTLPPGLSAALAGIPTCPEAATPTAACPPDSKLGYARIALGAGPEPLWAPTGAEPDSAVYLAGPYKEAPYSLLIAVPAQAGPYDLGTVIVRAGLDIDPITAQASVQLDPLPQIVAGVPLRYRDLRLVLDRPGLIRNPTSCEPAQIAGTATAANGSSATVNSRFQAADCAALRFRPRIALHLSGALARNGHPALRAALRARPGEAALAGAAFTMPPGELLDLHHIRALCARQLPPGRCPAASRLGWARIRSPALPATLRGPIYLRTPAHGLPDLLADLHGAGLHILLHGHTTAPGGRLRIRLSALPDAPLTSAVITLPGGRHGLLVNNESPCARPRHVTVGLSAHNGKRRRLRPPLRLTGRC